MNIIIIPIAKFIYTIFMTVFTFLTMTIFEIIETIWTLDWQVFRHTQDAFLYVRGHDIPSFYADYSKQTLYKSVYHFLWGIRK